jgi:hypothetical protein
MSTRRCWSVLGFVVFNGCGLLGSAGAATIYVSVGAVNGKGTQAAPYGTIQAGVNAAQAGDTVLVAPGTYRESVVVSTSGTAAAPLVIESSTAGAAVVSGSNPVGPFTKVSGSEAWQAASVPVFASTQDQAEQCFAGTTRLVTPRWPFTAGTALSSPNFAHIFSVTADTTTNSADSVGNQIHSARFTDPYLPAYNWVGATIQLLPYLGREQVTGTVTASSTHALQIKYPTREGDSVANGVQYLLVGSQMGLYYAGEWMRSGSNIQVRAPGDVNPNTLDMECKQRDYAFDLSGQSYVTLSGFTIQRASVTTDDQASSIRIGSSVAAANHIVLTGLTVDTPNSIADLSGDPYSQWTNNTGIVLSGTDNVLENSTIMHSDGNGVSLAGIGNQVLNNFVSESCLVGTQCGGINTGFAGMISTTQGAHTLNQDEVIAYNTVDRSGRALIYISSLSATAMSTSRIHHNILSGAVLQTYDNGAIYTYQFVPGSTWQLGIEIDHNIITTSPVTVYLDNYSSGFSVHHNIASSPGEPGLTDGVMIANDASNHLIANNTLIAESTGIYGIMDYYQYGYDTNVLVRNNILSNTNDLGKYATVDHDLFWNGVAGSSTDPKLTNVQLINFLLEKASPAINAGVAISGITNDTRAGSQDVTVPYPDLGAIDSHSASWVAALPADTTAPAITLTTPASGQEFYLQENVKASYNCADNTGGSGMARCTGSSRNREAINTSTAGAKSFTVTATDRAGNTTTVTHSYTVYGMKE